MPSAKFTIFLIVIAECLVAAALFELRCADKSTSFLTLALFALITAIVIINVETLYYTGG